MLARLWGRGQLFPVCECKLSAVTVEPIWRFLKKVKLELARGPARLLLGYTQWTLSQKDTPIWHIHVYCCPIQNSQEIEQAYMVIRSWMDKDGVEFKQNGVLFCHNEKGDHAICREIKGIGNHYINWNKTDFEMKISCFMLYENLRLFKCVSV